MIRRFRFQPVPVGLLLIILALVPFPPATAADRTGSAASEERPEIEAARGQEVVQAAMQGLKAVVELWRSHKFSDLYEWGTNESKRLLSKEQFIRLMKGSRRQLQCCWVTIQDLKGVLRSPTEVSVMAKLGYQDFQEQQAASSSDPPADGGRWVVSSSFDLRSFLMVFQQNQWRVDLSEVLQASGYLPETLGLRTLEIP